MPDVVSREERALIDAALKATPRQKRQVPMGKSGLPWAYWDGTALRIDWPAVGYRSFRAMQRSGARASGIAAQARTSSRNALIRDDVRAGLTYAELERKYELSRARLYEIVSGAGLCVAPRQRDGSAAEALTARIVAAVDGVRTQSEIAQLAGCSRRSVQERRNKLGLDIPDGKPGRPATRRAVT